MAPKETKPTKASKAEKKAKKEGKKANKSGKNANKGKLVVKSVLENPFSLTLPSIEEELLADIEKQLKSACSGISLPNFKPPFEDLVSLSGKERAKYREQYKEVVLKKLLSSPDAAQQYESAKEAHSHLIFGYNGVMRALERNELAGILLKANVEPKCLGQMFLPGCMSKGIPLVLVQDLDQLLKKEDMLGVNHSIMVLGLKTSIREPTCRFFQLWKSMMKVVHSLKNTCGFIPTLQMSDKVKVESMEVTSKDVKVLDNDKENIIRSIKGPEREEKLVNVLYKRMSPEEVKAYHLKRVTATSRVFIPQGKKMKEESMEDVIYMNPSKVKNIYEDQNSNREMANSNSSQEVDTVEKPSSMDFQLGFYLDTDPDEVSAPNKKQKTESNPKKQKTERNPKKQKTDKAERALMNYHLTEDDAYIPAKAKRIKSNPHKKEKKDKKEKPLLLIS